MTVISIDTKNKQSKKFLEFAKTLSFVTVHEMPNATTKKAIEDSRTKKVTKHKNSKDLISFLNR